MLVKLGKGREIQGHRYKMHVGSNLQGARVMFAMHVHFEGALWKLQTSVLACIRAHRRMCSNHVYRLIQKIHEVNYFFRMQGN